MEIGARDTGELQLVSGEIHDAWFEKADVRFHPDRQVMEIPLKREKWEERKTLKRLLFAKKVSTPVVRSILSVAHVRSYEIQDTARIGSYDIRGIQYHDDTVVISSNVPLTITLKVSGLDVSLVDADEVIEDRTGWTLF